MSRRVASGYIEGSNVNAAEQMVTMISLARQFEMQMKVLIDGRCQRSRRCPDSFFTIAFKRPTTMIRSLWIAKTGLDAQQTNLDVISNNLANVSTNGFKRSRAVFEDLLYQTMRQPGAQSSQQTQIPSGLMLGTGVRVSTERIFTQGSGAEAPTTRSTSRSMAMVSSRSRCRTAPWPIPAMVPLQLDSTGQIVTSSGYPCRRRSPFRAMRSASPSAATASLPIPSKA
jgi:flagellar basal body rod protein FlgG